MLTISRYGEMIERMCVRAGLYHTSWFLPFTCVPKKSPTTAPCGLSLRTPRLRCTVKVTFEWISLVSVTLRISYGTWPRAVLSVCPLLAGSGEPESDSVDPRPSRVCKFDWHITISIIMYILTLGNRVKIQKVTFTSVISIYILVAISLIRYFWKQQGLSLTLALIVQVYASGGQQPHYRVQRCEGDRMVRISPLCLKNRNDSIQTEKKKMKKGDNLRNYIADRYNFN